MPLLGHRYSLCVEKLRGLFCPVQFRLRTATDFTTPQGHDVQQFPQPWCFPHQQPQTGCSAAGAATDTKPLPPRGGWWWQSVLFPATNTRFQRHQLSMLFIPVYLKGPALTGLSKIPPTAKCQIALVLFLLRELKDSSFPAARITWSSP